jgi:WD40 repeat protein
LTDVADVLVLELSRGETRFIDVTGGRPEELPIPKGCYEIASTRARDTFACQRSGTSGTLLWKRGSENTPFEVGLDYARSIVFEPNGRWLVGTDKSFVRLFRVDRPELAPETLLGHTKEVAGLAFSLDGNALASGSFDGTIRIWPHQHQSWETWILDLQETVHKLIFLDDQRLLFIGSDSVKLINLDSQRMADLICGRPLKNLTKDEWSTGLQAKSRKATCPGLPLP